ncbi:hypothetical protein ACDQ55_00755 [Chitinophaga sp. 30R24]|uniref:hypothetical protein n=1 Tax=Chitinophaga sp. 30R24 TaxID=3248838 RepID=UPI003B90BFC6
MQDTITIQLHMTLYEYIRFTLYMLPRNKIIRKIFIYITCLSVINAGCKQLLPSATPLQHAQDYANFIYAPVLLALFFLVTSLLTAMYIFRYKPHFIQHITLRFTHWGMEKTGLDIMVKIPWRNFQKIEESKSFFILYAGMDNIQHVNAISKKRFTSLEKATAFKEMISYHILQ